MMRFQSAWASRHCLAIALLAPLAATCAPQPNAVLDLSEQMSLAEFLPETGGLDIGTPEARDALMDGWHAIDEQWLAGPRTFVWGLGQRSRVRFWAFRDGGRTLRLVGRPYVNGDRRTLAVNLVVNGSVFERIELAEGWGDYTFKVPPELIRRGENNLDLYYERELGTVEPFLDLSVAWDRINVGRQWVYGQPSSNLEGSSRVLDVPFFSQLDYYFTARPGQAVSLGAVRTLGAQVRAEGAHLQIEVATEHGSVVDGHVGADAFGDPHRFEIGVDAPVPARLTLRAWHDRPPERESGLRIAEPAVIENTPPATIETVQPLARQAADASDLPAPNVLVYLIDTLRADHLGIYGYPLETSPRIDAFADDAVTFDHAYTQSSWTRSAVASIFTGLVPIAHGVLERQDSVPEDAPLMAELFRGLGYQTLGVTTNGNVSAAFGFARGFDTYRHLGEQQTREIHRPSADVHAAFLRWLDDTDPDRPFFAYLHSTDPHGPYTPRPPFDARFPSPGHSDVLQPKEIPDALARDPHLTRELIREDLIPAYDGEIAYNDHTFGELLDALRERDLYDDTIVVLVADHGEEFLDHGGWGHGQTLFAENVRTPLLIKLPRQRNGGSRTPALAQHVDLLPTLLELAGGAAPESAQGVSQTAALRDPAGAEGAPWVRMYLQLDGRSLAGLIVDGYKVIRPGARVEHLRTAALSLFQIATDPADERDIGYLQPIRAGGLASQLRLLEGTDSIALQPGIGQADEALLERLRALGYVQ